MNIEGRGTRIVRGVREYGIIPNKTRKVRTMRFAVILALAAIAGCSDRSARQALFAMAKGE